jgi:hypothetical protein
MHGGHCADHEPIAAMAAAGPDNADLAVSPMAATMAFDQHGDTHPHPGAAAGACLFLICAVAGTAMAMIVALRHARLVPRPRAQSPPTIGERRPLTPPLVALGALRI